MISQKHVVLALVALIAYFTISSGVDMLKKAQSTLTDRNQQIEELLK